MKRARTISLSIVIQDSAPPSEFCIFKTGTIETTKGKFLFDDAACKSVMAEYQAHGIDLMIDYDHASLAALAVDPALAGKAAGWFNLEVRSGELWAVNVRWTEPAAAALARKEWRFMSPAFLTNADGRIVSVMNVAITNLPATRRLEPLMAASITALGATMDPTLVKKAIDALAAGDAEAALGILKDLIATAAGGDPDAATEDAPPPAGDGGADEPAEMAAAPADEDKQAVAAAISRLTRLSGQDTIAGAVAEVEVWRLSHLKLQAETDKLAKERAALELGKRKENAVALTKLGAETPHTTGLAKGKLCKRLAEEPLNEQNERIASLLAARGGTLPNDPIKAPVKAAAGAGQTFDVNGHSITLDARELAICADAKCDPKTFATLKARRTNTAT